MDYTLLYRTYGIMMNNRKPLVLLFVVLLFGVTGCVYLRFLKVKHQLEDFEKNFEIDDSIGLDLVFKNPVLEEGDIVWLMSSEPENNSTRNDQKVLTYILEKRYYRTKNEKDNYDIPVRFTIEDEHLTRVSLPERFLKYFSKSLFRNLLNSFGKADINKFSKEAKSNVKKSDSYKLPSTKEIAEVLGKPYFQKKDGSELIYIYKYHINTEGPDNRPGVKLEYRFNEKGEMLKSVKSNIKGIDIAIDFSDTT